MRVLIFSWRLIFCFKTLLINLARKSCSQTVGSYIMCWTTSLYFILVEPLNKGIQLYLLQFYLLSQLLEVRSSVPYFYNSIFQLAHQEVSLIFLLASCCEKITWTLTVSLSFFKTNWCLGLIGACMVDVIKNKKDCFSAILSIQVEVIEWPIEFMFIFTIFMFLVGNKTWSLIITAFCKLVLSIVVPDSNLTLDSSSTGDEFMSSITLWINDGSINFRGIFPHWLVHWVQQ